MYQLKPWVRNGDREILQQQDIWISESECVPILTFPLLEQTGIVKHAFTTRAGGVSSGEWASMNLSYTRGDDASHVTENFKRMAAVLGTDIEHMVCSMQTHTTNVLRVTAADGGNGIVRPLPYEDVDGLITDEPGVVLATFFADCGPLFFVDPVHHAIGLSHSGWRGTVHKMGQVTIEHMKRAFGTCPQDLYCAIGPSICQSCYEVSEDVAEQFLESFGTSDRLCEKKDHGKYQLNLWEANRQVLLRAGVAESRLQITDLCTCCNHYNLFSHRYSNGKRGNLAAFLTLK